MGCIGSAHLLDDEELSVRNPRDPLHMQVAAESLLRGSLVYEWPPDHSEGCQNWRGR